MCNKLGVLSALFNPKIPKIYNVVLYMIYCISVLFYRNSGITTEQQQQQQQNNIMH